MNTPQMTLLDYFAAASIPTAYQAFVTYYGPAMDYGRCAQMAYQLGNAMLIQSLNKSSNPRVEANTSAREAERDRCVGIVRSMLSKQPELQQSIIDQILSEV